MTGKINKRRNAQDLQYFCLFFFFSSATVQFMCIAQEFTIFGMIVIILMPLTPLVFSEKFSLLSSLNTKWLSLQWTENPIVFQRERKKPKLKMHPILAGHFSRKCLGEMVKMWNCFDFLKAIKIYELPFSRSPANMCRHSNYNPCRRQKNSSLFCHFGMLTKNKKRWKPSLFIYQYTVSQ